MIVIVMMRDGWRNNRSFGNREMWEFGRSVWRRSAGDGRSNGLASNDLGVNDLGSDELESNNVRTLEFGHDRKGRTFFTNMRNSPHRAVGGIAPSLIIRVRN